MLEGQKETAKSLNYWNYLEGMEKPTGEMEPIFWLLRPWQQKGRYISLLGGPQQTTID